MRLSHIVAALATIGCLSPTLSAQSTCPFYGPQPVPGPFTVVNPVIDVTIDGSFTGGVQNGEWSGVDGLFFVAGQNPFAVLPGDPNATVSAPVALGSFPIADEMYAIQAFLLRTDPFYGDGELVGEISFPIVDPGNVPLPTPPGNCFLCTLQVFADGKGGFFFLADLDGDGDAEDRAEVFGIEASVGFGPSPLSNSPHLIVEFEVSVKVQPGFGDLNGNSQQDGQEVFPPEGLDGVYAPNPACWKSRFLTDGGEMVNATDMLVTFDRLGITTASSMPPPSEPVPAVSEWGMAMMALLLMMGLTIKCRGGWQTGA